MSYGEEGWAFRKSGPKAGRRKFPCRACRRETERGTPRIRDYTPADKADERRHWKYGVTAAAYAQMLAAQGGGCAVCGTQDPGRYESFSVDHDHACCPGGGRTCGGCVRGLLCTLCNTGLGMLGDDPDRLRRAADYVEGQLLVNLRNAGPSDAGGVPTG